MTYYNQLRTLLCEVEEIKKDLSKLGRGVEVYVNKDAGIIGYGNIQCIKDYCEPLGELSLYGHNEIIKTYNISEVVGNNIEERHIRMYCSHINKCEKCGYVLKIIDGRCNGCIGDNQIDKCSCSIYLECSEECGDKNGGTEKNINDLKFYTELFFYLEEENILDNSKPFHQQDEEVYRQLVEYFNNIK